MRRVEFSRESSSKFFFEKGVKGLRKAKTYGL
jgi:hypothetical protein